MHKRFSTLACVVSLLALAACTSDAEEREQLTSEVRATLKAEGCSDAAACKLAGIGVRGCGGPREYVVYCETSTDKALLDQKLAAVAEHDRKSNEEDADDGISDTCSVTRAPEVALVDGVCRTR
jgi:hypothetical protein